MIITFQLFFFFNLDFRIFGCFLFHSFILILRYSHILLPLELTRSQIVSSHAALSSHILAFLTISSYDSFFSFWTNYPFFCTFRLHKDAVDLVVIYSDPRRMTDEFKIILSQFNRLPLLTLKVASCAINCDDTNDHRKYVKKNKLSCTLLSDPTRKVRVGVNGKKIIS